MYFLEIKREDGPSDSKRKNDLEHEEAVETKDEGVVRAGMERLVRASKGQGRRPQLPFSAVVCCQPQR